MIVGSPGKRIATLQRFLDTGATPQAVAGEIVRNEQVASVANEAPQVRPAGKPTITVDGRYAIPATGDRQGFSKGR